jgi:predicted transcriptional regulator
MTKVVPVKMSDSLYERLQTVAELVGEADSTIIRLVLRAGLAQIEKDKYQVFKFDQDFSEAGETRGADVDDLSTDSTRNLPPPLAHRSRAPRSDKKSASPKS